MQLKLSVHNRYGFPLGEEKVGDAVLCKQRPAEDAQHLIHTSIERKRFLNERNSTICYNGNVNLYSHSVFAIAPKLPDLKVLFYPFEERLDFPTTLIEQRYLAGLQGKVVGLINKCAVLFGGVVDYSANLGRIVLPVALGDETYRLVAEDIVVSIKHILTCRHLVFGLALLPNHKEGIQQGDTKQPRKIPVTSVEDIASPGLIFNIIHRIDIMAFCIGNAYCDRNIRDNVVLGMHLNTGLGAPKLCPIIKSQAERYGQGIKRVELAVYDKLTIYSRTLSEIYHVVCKALKKAIVSELIGFGKRTLVYRQSAKSKMKRLASVSRGEAVNSRRLRQPSIWPYIRTSIWPQ